MQKFINMNYSLELVKMRDKMHQEIIRESIRTIMRKELHAIVLDKPIQFNLVYYRPGDRDGDEEVLITGVDGYSSELTGTNMDGEERLILYRDVPIETLAILHGAVTSKGYTIQELIW